MPSKYIPRFSVRCQVCKEPTAAYPDRDNRLHFVYECLSCGCSADIYLRADRADIFYGIVEAKMQEIKQRSEQEEAPPAE